jgi:hypothetical protein
MNFGMASRNIEYSWHQDGADEIGQTATEQDKERWRSAEDDVCAALHTVITTFPFLCPLSTYL